VSEYHDREKILGRALSLASSLDSAAGSGTLISTPSGVSQTGDTGQAAFWLRPSDELDRILLHSIRSRIISAEASFPGAGRITAWVYSHAVREWVRRERAGSSMHEVRASLEEVASRLLAARPTRRRLHEEDLEVMLHGVPGECRSLLVETIRESPLGCLVSVRKSHLMETTIRRTSGCRISASPTQLLGSREVRSPRVVLVDGTIETVGQIHRMLEHASSSGTHYLLGCRGMSQEVEQTLTVNCARGTVSVLSFIARLDDMTVGALDDVAAFTGAVIISAQSGESVSSSFDRFITAQGKFWLEPGSIRSDATPSARLAAHIERLRSDVRDGGQPVQDFLSGRILGLSSSRVEVHLGESDTRQHPTIVESVDSEVRSLVAALGRGVTVGVADVEAPAWVSDLWRGAVSRPMCAGSAEAGAAAGIHAAVDLLGAGCAITSR